MVQGLFDETDEKFPNGNKINEAEIFNVSEKVLLEIPTLPNLNDGKRNSESPLTPNEENGKATVPHSGETNTRGAAAESDEFLPTDELIYEENRLPESETQFNFSNPNVSFPAVEAAKKNEPMLFQTSAKPELPEETARKTGLALSAGIALFASVTFLLIIGWGFDLLLGTSPWGIVGGIILGSIIGFFQFFRTTSQILKNKD